MKKIPPVTNPIEAMRIVGREFVKLFPDAYGAEAASRFIDDLMKKHPDPVWHYPEVAPEEAERAMYEEALDVAVAMQWERLGRPRYVVSESLAALLSMTRAPQLDLSNLPYGSVVVEIPYRYFPIEEAEGKPVYIVLSRLEGLAGPDGERRPVFMHALEVHNSILLRAWFDKLDESLFTRAEPSRQWMARLTLRYAANVMAYVTEHRECAVIRKAARNTSGELVHDVGVPKEVVVDKTLRAHAATLVQARNLASIRRTLRHVVSGHWKRQAHGPGRTERRMMWIMPYERGDASLGRVAERVLHVDRP